MKEGIGGEGEQTTINNRAREAGKRTQKEVFISVVAVGDIVSLPSRLWELRLLLN